MKLTDAFHIKICESVQPSTYWLAWGTNGGDLENIDEILSSEILNFEVGRTKETYNYFVEEDAAGVIEVGGKKWVISDVPTKFLYLKFQFPQDANSDKVIRQMGLFTDVALTVGNEGLTYIDTTADKSNFMSDIGILFETMNQADLTRDSSTEENYDIIIPF